MASKKPFFKYSKEQMEDAIADVKRGLAVATSARKHKVPRVTLMYKIQGKTPTERKMGRDSYLTKEEEGVLVTWILSMAKVGFPVGKEQLLNSVQHLMLELKRDNPFANNRPGKKWYASFLKRNPMISERTSQNLTITRASVTTGQLTDWFNEIFNYLQENKYDDILNDPKRIFNADETAFFLNPKGDKVMAERGAKNVYKIVNSDEKECLTALITGNAAGDLAPPMIIFRYERIPKELANSVPETWGIGKSESGWMTGETFYEFISNIFYPWLLETNSAFPVILFIDGHASHLTLHVSQFCDEHKIILVALLPNSTHKIQPMDVSVFRTLKAGWKEIVQEWRLQNYNNPILKKIHFSPLLRQTLEKRISPQILQNGFRKCGIYPWDPKAVDIATKKENARVLNVNNAKLTELQKGLHFVEKFISQDKVETFKKCSVWSGDIADQSLFEFYTSILKEINSVEKEVNQIQKTEKLQNQESLQNIKSIEDKENTDSQNQLSTAGPSQIPNLDNTVSVEENENTQKQHVTPPSKETRPSENIDLPFNVPTPFKKACFWPGPKPSKSKKYKKEKVPSVTTSKSWQMYYQKKELKKKELEEAKKKRLEDRKRKKELNQVQKDLNKDKKENSTNIKKTLEKRKRQHISSSSSEEDWVPSGNSSDDIEETYFIPENEPENDGLLNIDTDERVEYKEGDYILVGFPGKNRILHFVCVIQVVLENDELEVVGLKKCNDSNKNVFILNDADVSTIETTQIVHKLSFPNMQVAGDRIKYEFKEDLRVDG